MEVVCYPDGTDPLSDSLKRSLKKAFVNLKTSYPQTYSLVENVINQLRNGKTTIATLRNSEKYSNLKGSTLDELRIPPNGRSGVFRGYCSIIKAGVLKEKWSWCQTISDLGNEDDVLVLFTAEVKKNFTRKADSQKINQAEKARQELLK